MVVPRRRSNMVASSVKVLTRVLVPLVSALTVAVCSSPQAVPPPAQTGTSSTTRPAIATTSTTAIATTTTNPRRSGSHRFMPESLVRASGNVVYLLGSAGCSARLCSRLLRSSDDGLHFVRASLPSVAHSTAPIALDSIRYLQFANPEDGYLLVGSTPGVLYMTDDGARTWPVVRFGRHASVLSIATTPQSAYVTVSHCKGEYCGADRLARSLVGSALWTVVSAIPANKEGGWSLEAAVGKRVWLGTGGGTGDVKLALSANEGKSFVLVWSEPVLGCDLTPTSDAVVWLDCSGGMMGDWFRSTDGGRTFRALSIRPYHSDPFDPVSDTVAFYLPAAGVQLYRTANAGRSFGERGVIPVKGAQGASVSFVGASHGLALVGPQQELFRTSDGGVTWTRVQV